MNNCYYLWMKGGVSHGEAHVEERDRSLPVVEVTLPTVRPPFQLADQMLDDEELPELSTSDPDSYSNNGDSPSSKESLKHTAQAQRDVRNVSRIPAASSVASSSQSLMRTPHRKKFLSRSHNSLVFRPPDYSKVESKVRKYIVSMREQQKQRRQCPQSQFSSVPTVPLLALEPFSVLKAPEEVANLKRQLIDQEVRVEVLQEDHDRLLLHNARLQNMLDEMRTKVRILHSQQQQQLRPKPHERRTNSPPQPEVDKHLSSLESFSSIGGGDPLAAIQLGLAHQYQTLSITPSSYLDLPPKKPNRKTGDDETSSCDSSWSSIGRLRQKPLNIAAPVGLENGNITKPVFLDESLPENNDQHQEILLLKQLKEITLAAMEVRDQTRNIILQMNLIRPSLNGEL